MNHFLSDNVTYVITITEEEFFMSYTLPHLAALLISKKNSKQQQLAALVLAGLG